MLKINNYFVKITIIYIFYQLFVKQRKLKIYQKKFKKIKCRKHFVIEQILVKWIHDAPTLFVVKNGKKKRSFGNKSQNDKMFDRKLSYI